MHYISAFYLPKGGFKAEAWRIQGGNMQTTTRASVGLLISHVAGSITVLQPFSPT